jgi:protein involved in polysaccharide export with SLBB domain
VSRAKYEKDTENRIFLTTQLSLRNIELIRKDGKIQKVDIYRFFSTNDDKYNPHFQDGDLLKIPNSLLEKNYVTVSGAVQLAGAYEYSPDDDLEMLIGLGRGFDANAEQDSIVLYRPKTSGTGFNVIDLNYHANKNFKINNFDRIFVKYRTDYFKKVTVLVMGEVKRPGYYPIAFKKTKIKDAIEMAGGLTEDAYLPLSILFRKYDREYTAKDTTEILINQRGNDLIITEMDKENFWYDVRARRNRVVVDFEKLINKNDDSQNISLDDNDVIYINDNKNIVYVYGQVGNEGYVPFKKGEDAEYYIEQAGGYSLAADDGNTRIIKFNSRGWYEPGDIEVESGDYIYVPKETRTEFKDWVQIVSQFAGILVGLLTIYLLIKQSE